MRSESFKRLENKTQQGLFAMHLENQYKLPPVAARTLSQDVVIWQNLFQPRNRGNGQIVHHAVKRGQPACKCIRDCELVEVKLTLIEDSDLPFQRDHGLQALNMRIMERICREAFDQNAVLSVEDVSFLLRLSESTVKRYRKTLLAAGRPLVMRGDNADMGPGTSHREAIVRLFIQGYSESDIALRTSHALESVEAYVRDFLRVALLGRDGYEPIRICGLTKLSKRKVWGILALYKELDANPDYSPALSNTLNIYELNRRFEKKGAPRS